MYVAGPMYTMVDSSKGSMTNRVQCAKEHLKNKWETNIKTGLVTSGVAYGLIKKPTFLKYIATGLGTILTKVPFLKNSISNPTKAGKIGLLVAAGAYVLNTILKGVYKAGQIDQKYTDAAKIESQTKNVILEKQMEKEDDKKNKYCRGLIV